MPHDVGNVNIPDPAPGTGSRAYHHGNLRATLVAEGLAALEEGERADVSLRELARRAGVSPNAAYRHFKDKDALLAALAAEGFRQLTEAAEASQTALPDARDEKESFRAYGRAYVVFASKHPALFRLMFGRFTTSERTEELQRAGGRTFRDLHVGVAATSGLPPDDPRVATGALYAWSLVHGLSNLILDGQIDGDPAALAEAVLSFGVPFEKR
jgi:AcrR family transcriptional regulator